MCVVQRKGEVVVYSGRSAATTSPMLGGSLLVSYVTGFRLGTVIITTFMMFAWKAQLMGVDLRQVSGGVVVPVFVKPHSKQFQLKVEDDTLVVLCRESPVKGKVNKELIKELSRIFKKRVEIVAGLASKQKTVLITGINTDEANKILSEHASRS